jgi:hypothetical protein
MAENLDEIVVVGLGSKMFDLNIPSTRQLLAILRSEIRKVNAERIKNGEAPYPSITSNKGGQLDALHSVFKKVLDKNRMSLVIKRQDDNSFFYSFNGTNRLTPELIAMIKSENRKRKSAGENTLALKMGPQGATCDVRNPIFQNILAKNIDVLKAPMHEGGSVYNTLSDARILLAALVNMGLVKEEDAKRIVFEHIPSTREIAYGYNFIHYKTKKKIMAAFRPKEALELSPTQIDLLQRAGLLFFPKSTHNKYAGLLATALELIPPGTKVFPTLHGDDLARDLKQMLTRPDAKNPEGKSVDVLCGNEAEFSPEAYKKILEGVLKGDFVAMITKGEKGLDVKGNGQHIYFPTVSVQNAVNDVGTGNGAEAALLLYTLGILGDGIGAIYKLGWLANAAGGATMVNEEADLSPKNIPLIVERYRQIANLKFVPMNDAKPNAAPNPI